MYVKVELKYGWENGSINILRSTRITRSSVARHSVSIFVEKPCNLSFNQNMQIMHRVPGGTWEIGNQLSVTQC